MADIERFLCCTHPAALWVNQESRACCLKSFVRIENTRLDSSGFFINLRDDTLRLGQDDGRKTITKLKTCYGDQLRQIQNMILCEDDFEKQLKYLVAFSGLKLLQVMLENYENINEPTTVAEYHEAAKRLRTEIDATVEE
nr:uncharacterized protein CTRU02_07876 [Colletotrichum truncatum]KAF6790970.1 hypothetical protein CTRU02_07876 [Colletotrichum truncatum]